MNFAPLLFSLATFFSTLGGGLFALKYNDRLHLILSFTAGVLLGVVSFDILPEIFRLAHEHNLDPGPGMGALVAGFLIFHGLEKVFNVHHVHDKDYNAGVKSGKKRHPKLGVFSALALAGHSFMDGVGIGLAFQVSHAVGIVVAIAVISHDFCDGLNTVSLMLVNKNTRKHSFFMLLLDAIAPVLGAACAFALKVPPIALVVYLGFFGGFLFYIGAADILPEAHSRNTSTATAGLIALTCAGAGFIYFVIRFAG